MATRKTQAAETFGSERRRQIIQQVQTAVARELAKEYEPPKTVPQRIADLVRELHKLLRDRP